MQKIQKDINFANNTVNLSASWNLDKNVEYLTNAIETYVECANKRNIRIHLKKKKESVRIYSKDLYTRWSFTTSTRLHMPENERFTKIFNFVEDTSLISHKCKRKREDQNQSEKSQLKKISKHRQSLNINFEDQVNLLTLNLYSNLIQIIHSCLKKRTSETKRIHADVTAIFLISWNLPKVVEHLTNTTQNYSICERKWIIWMFHIMTYESWP